MNKNFKAAIILVAFCAIFAHAAVCSAQVIVGGYREISKTDEIVAAAANFAVQTQAQQSPFLKLVSIERVSRQIVQGSNYKMCLIVTAKNERQEATAVVYHNLQNELSLTSWTPGKCSTGAAAAASQPPTAKASVTVANVAGLAPDHVVKNLYAAQKSGRNAPFYQTANRAAVDLFFTKDFADLIWQDALEADGVGVLGADPLYNAQDTEITMFKIGKPKYGNEAAATHKMATVEVSFRNFRKPETIRFIFAQNDAQAWKISDIRYQNGDLLKGMYTAAQADRASEPARFKGDLRVGAATTNANRSATTNAAANSAVVKVRNQATANINSSAPAASAANAESYKTAGELQTGKNESVILYLGAESGDYAAFCFANDSTVGRAVAAACKNGEQCEFNGEVDFAADCKVPGLEATLSAHGKITKIKSVKSLGRKK